MKINDNILTPGIEIHAPMKEEKRQKDKAFLPYPSTSRRNNRENTRSRKTQYIHYVDDSVFPPKFKQKTIKHTPK